jgi:hypothetical protein
MRRGERGPDSGCFDTAEVREAETEGGEKADGLAAVEIARGAGLSTERIAI